VLRIVSRMHQQGLTMSQIISKIRTWENSGEINFKIERKDEAIEAVRNRFMAMNPLKVLDFDGYRIEFPDWWFNIRKSNTEPYLRLLVEAKSSDILHEKTGEIISLIQQFQ